MFRAHRAIRRRRPAKGRRKGGSHGERRRVRSERLRLLVRFFSRGGNWTRTRSVTTRNFAGNGATGRGGGIGEDPFQRAADHERFAETSGNSTIACDTVQRGGTGGDSAGGNWGAMETGHRGVGDGDRERVLGRLPGAVEGSWERRLSIGLPVDLSEELREPGPARRVCFSDPGDLALEMRAEVGVPVPVLGRSARADAVE